MFRLLHGVSEEEWRTNPDVRFPIPPFVPELDGSGDESGDESTSAGGDDKLPQDGWRSGEQERDAAKQAGKWPDGAPLGRGHGSPYLQPEYALKIAAAEKTVEGRPREGVCARVASPPQRLHSQPTRAMCASAVGRGRCC